ncbi:hypothetical protein BC938DRAFT_480154, partial [Jimgerdemannia flammicorona]
MFINHSVLPNSLNISPRFELPPFHFTHHQHTQPTPPHFSESATLDHRMYNKTRIRNDIARANVYLQPRRPNITYRETKRIPFRRTRPAKEWNTFKGIQLSQCVMNRFAYCGMCRQLIVFKTNVMSTVHLRKDMPMGPMPITSSGSEYVTR